MHDDPVIERNKNDSSSSDPLPTLSKHKEIVSSRFSDPTKNGAAIKKRSKRRIKRENFPLETPVFVETAVFVDRDLFDHMKTNFPTDTDRELIRFVLAMINAVSYLPSDLKVKTFYTA